MWQWFKVGTGLGLGFSIGKIICKVLENRTVHALDDLIKRADEVLNEHKHDFSDAPMEEVPVDDQETTEVPDDEATEE